MILRYQDLSQHAAVFKAMTGSTVDAFGWLMADLLPRYAAAEAARRHRPQRKRAPGAGGRFTLAPRDQLLLVLVWLRQYPTQAVLAYLFGANATTVSHTLRRLLPLFAASGEATFPLPAAGRRSRRGLAALLADTPELAVIVDSFEQRVPRPKDRTVADTFDSGKKKHHTLKSQVAVEEGSGRIVDVSARVPGPTTALDLLRRSGLLGRVPLGVGALGDLAYGGMRAADPQGLAATGRRKPRGKPRPPEAIADNRACASRRIGVEHSIGRLRHYQVLSQRDRHHRSSHRARVCAVAGLVNRQIARRAPC